MGAGAWVDDGTWQVLVAPSNRELLTESCGGPETVSYAIAFGGAASPM